MLKWRRSAPGNKRSERRTWSLVRGRDDASIDACLTAPALPSTAREQRRAAQRVAEYEKQVAAEKAKRQAQDMEASKLAAATRSETAVLNDPAALRKGRPARDGDHDIRCGPASAQRFDGEDLRAGERRALQAAQMRRWAEAAHAEKLARQEAEAEEAAAYMQYVESMNGRVEEHEHRLAQERAARLREVAAENKRLAALTAAQRAQEQAEAAAAAARGQSLPGLLDESVADRESALGPGRVRPDAYRGMSAEEHAALLEEQRRQAEAARAAKQAEREAEWREARQAAEMSQRVAQYEKSLAQEKARQRAEYLAQLERQVAEKAAAKRAEAEADRKSGFGDGFFGGFGRSDR